MPIINSEKFKRAKRLLQKNLDYLDDNENLPSGQMANKERELRKEVALKFGMTAQQFNQGLAQEKGETSYTESITGDKVLDIKLKFNYTSKEIEFLQDGNHPLTEGKTWRQRLNDPEINSFLLWRRKQKQKEKNQ